MTAAPFTPPSVADITADDATIADAVACAAVPALLPAVAQLTGDLSLLRDDLRPDPGNLLDADGGLTPEQVAEARTLAVDALVAVRDGRIEPAPPPGEADLRRMMAFQVGDANVGDYAPLLREELALGGEDLRAPSWTLDEVAPGRTMAVAVIGAGMSGLLAAHRLRQAGVDVVVLERDADVGGTWLQNTYPGCRVDVANNLYSYSFAQTAWPQHFSSQDVLLDYFRRFADAFELRELIRFGTEVVEAVWSEDDQRWTVRTRTTEGVDGELVVDAVVSAVGQLNRPRYPDIDGMGDFAGPAFHSARWDHSVDLAGKRVAVIGTGASAMQLIPSIAPEVAELTVLQRTPAWLVPTPEYYQDIPDGMTWLFEHLPSYGQWYRLWLFWRNHEGLLPAAVVDPDWDGGERSVSAANDLVRMLLTAYLEEQYADRPDLLEATLPAYPPIAKRVIRDDGTWPATLKMDHVHLVTEGIERIEAGGVRTVDGVLHEADVLVYGTGFTASEFLVPLRVVGRHGVELHDAWAGEARAYLGITVPGFPNLFCCYGPNTNIVINGSIIYFSELEVRYVLEVLRLLAGTGQHAVDPRRDVHDAYNAAVDEANAGMAWGASSVSSWYKNASGRVAQNWPWSLLEYWQRTRTVDPDDYVIT